MKIVLAIGALFFLSLGLPAQPRTVAGVPPSGPARPSAPPNPNLNAILADLQRTTQAANLDLSKLRIEKWKVDDSERQQMQQVAASLQKNITIAVPGLVNDLQAAPGSVSKAFKLYHNMNVVYEFLNSLTEAAGVYGKREEYEPLANDASALDRARQNLSNYIETAANNLEVQAQKPVPVQSAPATAQGPKKIVIDDGNGPAKKTRTKKKKPAASPSPSPTPSQ